MKKLLTIKRVGVLAAPLPPTFSYTHGCRRRKGRYYIAFYPGKMDACFVNGERVHAQEGDFYGGWITGDIIGLFKGEPGTFGW